MEEPEYIPRKRVYTKFKDLLESKSNIQNEQINNTAINIERAIFNYALVEYGKYHDKMNKWNNIFKWYYINRATTIYVNLNPDSYVKNASLLNRLQNGEFKEWEMCFFTPKELCPEKYEGIELDLSECMLPQIEFSDDGMHKCGKCKTFRTLHHSLQTRSGDESETIFVTCKCGNSWKYNP